MNRRIVFFTGSDAALGFSLAGFEQYVCTSEELAGMLESVMANPDYGLFVIDERLMTENIENRLHEADKDSDQIFVILPPPLETKTKREDYAVRLLRKAIGYHVQLNI